MLKNKRNRNVEMTYGSESLVYTELFEAKERIKELEIKLEKQFELNYILDQNNDLMKKEVLQLKSDKKSYFKKNLLKYDVEIKDECIVISNSNNTVVIDTYNEDVKSKCLYCLSSTIGVVKKCCGYSICSDCFVKSAKYYTTRNGVHKPLIAFCSICDKRINNNFNYDDWEDYCINNLS